LVLQNRSSKEIVAAILQYPSNRARDKLGPAERPRHADGKKRAVTIRDRCEWLSDRAESDQ
ncbi:hypothetical protein, partial [Staphylococcus aureus]|uniref:hypothetical protein n=1 Tax=Staphylococcus aureus TaxID=1280 RepID=UPI0032B33DF2